MSPPESPPDSRRESPPERPSTLTGLAVLRAGGVPVVQRRLPRRSAVSLGRRDRHGFELRAEWAPRDLAVLTPVEEGWLVANGPRTRMRVETDWVDVGHVQFLPGAVVMLQRGETRLSWPGLDGPVSLSVTVRTRRLDDQRIPYAVDSRVDGQPQPADGSYLGVRDAPMSSALRYRLAVLFRHEIEGEPEPLHVVRKRAEFLGVTEADLEESAHRYRRRLNAVRDLALGDLYDLGRYLVRETGELTRADLDP